MDATRFPQKFINRLFERAKAEEAAEALPQREADVAAIAAANERYEREYPLASKAAVKAAEKVERAKKEYEAAYLEARRLRAVAMGISAAHDGQVGSAEGRLKFGADPAIAETKTVLHQAWQATRRNENVETLSQSVKEHFGEPATMIPVASNTASIANRLRAIEAALRECDRLALLADQSGVPAALQSLLAGIPAIEPARATEPGIGAKLMNLVGAKN